MVLLLAAGLLLVTALVGAIGLLLISEGRASSGPASVARLVLGGLLVAGALVGFIGFIGFIVSPV